MVSFGFCLWQGGTRRPAIGDLRVMRRSEDAIQALRPSEPPPRAGGRNEEPQPPHGQGAHHDRLYGRGANLNSTTVETGRLSRRAMRHPARGTVAAAADVCCAAQRRAWQFLANRDVLRALRARRQRWASVLASLPARLLPPVWKPAWWTPAALQSGHTSRARTWPSRMTAWPRARRHQPLWMPRMYGACARS